MNQQQQSTLQSIGITLVVRFVALVSESLHPCISGRVQGIFKPANDIGRALYQLSQPMHMETKTKSSAVGRV